MSNKKSLIEDLSDIPILISQSETGDIQASLDLLKRDSEYRRNGTLPPKELAMWIAEKLEAIVTGVDPKTALNLKRSRGKPPSHSEEMERLIAEAVRDAPGGLHKGSNLDGSKKGAYLEAAIKFGVTENTAEKYYKNQIDRIILEEQIAQETRNENPD
jgi:hypothetical protein